MLLDVRKPQNYLDVAVSLSKELADSVNEGNAQVGISGNEIERLRKSGLLALVVPQEYGGIGATWSDAFKVVQELSQADASIGQVYGNHLNLTSLAHVSGTPEQKKRYYQHTARNNWFWANAINTWDTGLRIIPEEDNFRFNGVTSFDAVVTAADLRVFSAVQDGAGEPFFFIIPRDREGIISNHAEDNLGQGGSDRTTFTFHNVLVKKDEILQPVKPSDSGFSTILGIIAQLTKIYVCLGVARGALEAAQKYSSTLSNSWNAGGVESTTHEPYGLGNYSDLWLELKTALKLTDRVADMVQIAWEKELTLTHEEREEIAIAVFSAETFATRIGLDISNRIFKLIGTPSKDTKYGFDRYWRDLHTFGGVSMPWQGAPQNWKLTNFQQQTPW
jgi:alkylation response protein AidB-like acyl-CoA dehydrogenase